MDLLALAERVERATEPSRELDIEILRAVTKKHWLWHRSFPAETVVWWNEYGADAHGNPVVSLEPYTASLDAAMHLMPASAQWTIEADGAWVRWLGKDDVEEVQSVLVGRNGTATPLAVVAACLKAKAALTNGMLQEDGK